MTNITITKTKDGFEAQFLGHAGYAQFGSDIVCAGISTLSYALIGAVKNIKASHVWYSECPGELIIKVSNIHRPNRKEQLKTVLMTIYIGLKQLELKYSENISVKFDDFLKI